jgi:hypothetical protein
VRLFCAGLRHSLPQLLDELVPLDTRQGFQVKASFRV